MKFGLLLPLSGPHGGIKEIQSTAMLAEELGFDSVWSYDLQLSGGTAYRQHVVCGAIEDVDPSKPPVFYEPLTSLAFIAAKTTRISIGTGVVILPLTNPFTVAKQAANLDVLSGGRFILGVGIGSKSPYSREAFRSFGIPFEERGLVHDEYLRAIISLWKEPKTTISGKYLHLKDIELYPKPTNPRIWVAARGGPGFKRVAELGDGWFPANFSPKEIASGITKVRSERKAMGRDERFEVASMNYICVGRNMEDAIEQSRQTLKPRVEGGSYGRAKSLTDAYDRCLLGNASDIVKQLEKYTSTGVDHEVFTVLFRGGMEKLYENMKTMATEVFPSFR